MARGRTTDRGMYGLRFAGLPASDAVLAPVPADWPVVRLRHHPAEPLPEVEGRRWTLDAARGEVRLYDGAQLLLTRDPLTIEVVGPAVEPDLLVHPYLTPAVSFASRWLGREAFHGGAFLVGDRAFAVLGTGGAGKSTLLAALAGRGVPVVADDLLIVDGSRLFAGPRTIDLRQAPTAELRGALAVGRSRRETRWRLALPPVAAEHQLGGWIFLGPSAGAGLSAEPIGVKGRLARLARLRVARHLPSDPAAMLDLAALPAWELRRPLSWSALDETVDTLQSLAADATARSAAR